MSPRPMNPFQSLKRLHLAPALLRWPKAPPAPIPIERPPRSLVPRGRIQLVWHSDPNHPFPFEVEGPPPSADGFRLQPWF